MRNIWYTEIITVIVVLLACWGAYTREQSAPPLYKLVENRGTAMHIVVVEPSVDLKDVGKALHADFVDDHIAAVLVFDNMRAAGMYDRMTATDNLSLGVKEDRFYDRHLVATYSKNDYSGLNEFVIGGHKSITVHY